MSDASRGGPSLLAQFGGKRPPAPQWFDRALANIPDRSHFEHDGASIEMLTWGPVGKPGLLFLHGNAAHADWWSFIAPYFAQEYRCAAISWSGMGRSGWRSRYSIESHAHEALHAIEAAGLDRSGRPPLVVCHSFGTGPLLYIATHFPQRIAGAALIDALSPRPPQGFGALSALPDDRELPRYETEAEALARFRFMPAQTSDLPAVVDFLARGSLQHLPGEGWTWRFDPRIWAKFDRTSQTPDLLRRARVPLGLIYGAESVVITAERLAAALDDIADCRFVTAIPAAGHHIMADQPIALVTALRLALPLLTSAASNPASPS